MAVPVATLLMVVTKKTAEYKAQNDLAGIRSLVAMTNYRVFFAGSLALAIFLIASPLIRDYLHAPATAPIVLLGISIFIALAFPINAAVLQGIQDYTWFALLQSLAGPAKLLLCLLFVMIGFSVNGVMVGFIFSGLLLWYLSYIPVRKFIRPIPVNTSIINHISFSQVVPVFFANLAFAVLTQADIIFVTRYFTAHDAGMYAAAAILGKAVMYIPAAIVLALFPMVSEHAALNRSSRHLLIKAFLLTLAISGFGALAFYLFPGAIVSIIYGTRYLEAYKILKYYGIAMLPMAMLLVLMNYLIAQGRRLFTYVMVVGALVELAIVLLWHDSQFILIAVMLIISACLFVAGVLLQFLREYFPTVKLLQ